MIRHGATLIGHGRCHGFTFLAFGQRRQDFAQLITEWLKSVDKAEIVSET
jgi:hypothetical protein